MKKKKDALKRDLRFILIEILAAKIIPVARDMTSMNWKSLSIATVLIRQWVESVSKESHGYPNTIHAFLKWNREKNVIEAYISVKV